MSDWMRVRYGQDQANLLFYAGHNLQYWHNIDKTLEQRLMFSMPEVDTISVHCGGLTHSVTCVVGPLTL